MYLVQGPRNGLSGPGPKELFTWSRAPWNGLSGPGPQKWFIWSRAQEIVYLVQGSRHCLSGSGPKEWFIWSRAQGMVYLVQGPRNCLSGPGPKELFIWSRAQGIVYLVQGPRNCLPSNCFLRSIQGHLNHYIFEYKKNRIKTLQIHSVQYSLRDIQLVLFSFIIKVSSDFNFQIQILI